MKLQQLRYFLEVYRCNLNISEAAEILFTSQPGISKQIKLLEDELGVQLFVRHGKRIAAVTPPGQAVLEIAERIFRDVQSIRNIGTEFAEQDSGRLTIATTHTQAQHVLPPVVAEFFRQYPKVELSLVPAEPSAVDRMVADGLADFAINSEADERHSELRYISARAWNRCVLVPKGHGLAGRERIGLADLSAVPLIAYTDAAQDAALQAAFAGSGLPLPRVVLASVDAGVIKTYVRAGLGAGLLADTAYDPERDDDLACLRADHLFQPSFTYIVVRQDAYLRNYAYDFIQLYLPGLSRERIEQALYEPIREDFSI
ncbi:LysR family transcriptional regulator [Eikenella sp. S3360]|uniref:LysR family transcriptional regulator n=1 Tax=Eikenella glucosivorans TaxID=2766967 RepID=A0ABS0NDE9_9NEIS|nr:LysR substrate-binding domain-containing protein [Eikenella glucosivorans]MBH5330282.1 LysR family transcriptional regulator [Eikenella glucosivorans]